MAKTSIFEPLFDDGLASINFFNGRLLSAEDLKTERKAHREGHRRLGQAVGDGVVYGMDVRKSAASTTEAPSVTVSAGLAINRSGDAIRLEHDTEVSLRTAQAIEGTQIATIFRDCVPPRGGDYVPSSGAYVLAITSLRGGVGLAQVSGLGNELAGCNTKYLIEGVEFELHELALDPDASDLAHLRNHLAYACIGIPRLTDATSAAFSAAVGDYGRIGALRTAGALSRCAVPLAVVYWTGAGVQFVDRWAVRRRPVPLTAGGAAWESLVERRRMAEAEAMLWQFQEHLSDVALGAGDPASVVAKTMFNHLPPAGLLPLGNTLYPRGFVSATFFRDVLTWPARPIRAAQVRPLLIESLSHEPCDLAGTARIQLYSIVENTAAQSGTAPPQPFVIFTVEHLHYISNTPRFADLCRTVRETIAAYRSLLDRGIFFSGENTLDALMAKTAVDAEIRAVIHTAGDQAAVICYGAGTLERALFVLRALYDAQKHLVAALLQTWTGVRDVRRPTEFGERLRTYLDVAGNVGAQPLKDALDRQDLDRATVAQDEINGFVRLWSGDVTTGTLDVKYQRSTRGRAIVIGDANPFRYVFRITNRTNKTAEVQLTADFDPSKTSWNNAITIQDLAGNAKTAVTLEPFDATDPNNPKAFHDAQVSVITPGDATLGETRRLRLMAAAPAPVSVGNLDTVEIKAGNAEEPDTDFFELTVTAAPGNALTATQNTPVVFNFTGTFKSPLQPPTPTKKAVLKITVTSPTTASDFTIDCTSHDVGGSSATEVKSAELTFSRNTPMPLVVRVVGKPGGVSLNKTITFEVKLSPTDATPEVKKGPFTVTVTS